jgi:hypothetical protein
MLTKTRAMSFAGLGADSPEPTEAHRLEDVRYRVAFYLVWRDRIRKSK